MNSREKLLIIVLAAVVILLGGFKLLIEPEMKRFSNANAEYNQAANSWERALENKQQAETIEKSNQLLETEIAEKAGPFFPELEADKIHIFFDQLADGAGLKYESFTMTKKIVTQISVPRNAGSDTSYPAKDAVQGIEEINGESVNGSKTPAAESQPPKPNQQPKDLVEMMTVSIQFKGTYGQGLALVKKMTTSGRLIRISSFDMTKERNSDVNKNDITISITAECFGVAKMTADELSLDTQPKPSGKSNPFD